MKSWQRRLSAFQASFQQQTGVTHGIAFPAPYLLQNTAWELLLRRAEGEGAAAQRGCPFAPRTTMVGTYLEQTPTKLAVPKSSTHMRTGACEVCVSPPPAQSPGRRLGLREQQQSRVTPQHPSVPAQPLSAPRRRAPSAI